jgi:hypothetical protein
LDFKPYFALLILNLLAFALAVLWLLGLKNMAFALKTEAFDPGCCCSAIDGQRY